MRAFRHSHAPLGIAVALAALALFFGGGSGDAQVPWIGIAAVAGAVALLAARGLPRGGRALVPLAALAVWCALSIGWSWLPDRSWSYANRSVVLLAFALVGLFVAPRRRELALALCAVLAAVVVWSLAGKVVPSLYPDYGRIARLRAPIGIWNQLALVADYALPLALWLALSRRLAGVLLAYAWIVALLLTYSRGGILVALVVVAAWIALSRRWLDAGATLVAAGAPAVVVFGIALALPGVTSDAQPHSTRVRDGILFGLALLAGAGAAAALARMPMPRETPALRRAARVAVAVLAALALAVVAVKGPDAWRSFTNASAAPSQNDVTRLTTASSNFRWPWWQQAWHGFRTAPLVGTGAGSFELVNDRYRRSYLDLAVEPHDLPLQFLCETGLVGLALFLATAAAFARRFTRGEAHELALSLVVAAFFLHGLVEIDWDFVAVSAPAFLVAGALAGRAGNARRASLPGALVVAGLALAACSSFVLPWLADRWTNEASALDRPAHSAALARRARSANPVAIEPLYWQALAEQLRRRDGAALAALQKATDVQPHNALGWLWLGRFWLDRGCPREALPALERYTELDPQPRDPGGGQAYNTALRQVDSGKYGSCVSSRRG